ncbi:PREDICTED: kinesin-like protein KIF26A, partial [Bison bison bison]|uniref:Kinesin-like protein KIF26A n=1 Tax=Bison bison bison TaxID=43346 RepID=A0A6P3GMP2_BISBB
KAPCGPVTGPRAAPRVAPGVGAKASRGTIMGTKQALRATHSRVHDLEKGPVCVSARLRLAERRLQRLQEVQAKRELLRGELAETQGRLMLEPGRWLEQFEVDPGLEPESAEYLVALERATAALEQCVNLCKAHVMMVTCFDISAAAPATAPGPQEWTSEAGPRAPGGRAPGASGGSWMGPGMERGCAGAGQCGAHCSVASLSRGAAPDRGAVCVLSACLPRRGAPGGVVSDSLLLPSSDAGLGPVGLGAQAEQTREPRDRGRSQRRVQRP